MTVMSNVDLNAKTASLASNRAYSEGGRSDPDHSGEARMAVSQRVEQQRGVEESAVRAMSSLRAALAACGVRTPPAPLAVTAGACDKDAAPTIRTAAQTPGPPRGILPMTTLMPILLYTGTSDAEGTLGGLVNVGRHVEHHLKTALDLGRLCSNDPVCAQHRPDNAEERRFLHGAACHGCLLISEHSCEMKNEYLDRALVVPTVAGHGCAFFEGA